MAGCEDCGRSYGDEFGFPDLIIPLDVWERISTAKDESGLLCPSCICKRLYDAGISGVEGAFMSGPIESVNRTTMYNLRWIENIRRRLRGMGIDI
jgi:hypothetical protein